MTSELCRPSTEVEVPDENDAIECTQEEQCSEVENMSDDESEVQCSDEEEEGRRSQASELPWSADDSRARQGMPCHISHTAAGAPTAAQEEPDAGSTEQTRGQRGAYSTSCRLLLHKGRIGRP